jgi:hypothetical protein
MIRTAMEEAALGVSINVNNPTNHNLEKTYEVSAKEKYQKKTNTLDLKVIMEDQVLPAKSILIGKCKKKNKTFGSEVRFLLLGASQLIIARDEKFEKIVGVIPLEGGFCVINKSKKEKNTILLLTLQRMYTL